MDPSTGDTVGPALIAAIGALGVAIIGGAIQVTLTVLGWRHKPPTVEPEDDPVMLTVLDQLQRITAERDTARREAEQWRGRYEALLRRSAK